MKRIGRYVTNLNLFDDETNDEHIKRNQILSTQFYIILLIGILSGFTLYTSLPSQTTINIISIHTQDQYEELQMKFSNTLQCPCQNIVIAYEEFISIQPYYHQICSSDFVSQRWIDYLFYQNISYYFQLDFRHSAFAQFQALRTLCQQAQQTIEDSLTQFNSMQFITTQLVSPDVFHIQSDAFIDVFNRTTPPLFQNIVKLFRQMSINNRLFSGLESNYVIQFYVFYGLLYALMNNIYYYELLDAGYYFDCFNDSVTICQLPEGIYANIIQYDYAGSAWVNQIVNGTTSMINATLILPGLFIGCQPIESLMQTTTECFFEKICLNTISSYINYSTISNKSFSILNRSRFSSQTTIETLVNDLFVEEWIINKSFTQYFDQCQPLSCQYKDEQRHNLASILTTIISVYGGLTVVLRSLIPIIVTFIRKKKQQLDDEIDDTSQNVSWKARLYSLLQQGINFILKLNLFDSHSSDERAQNSELISTRIYIIVLIFSLISFTFYTSITRQIKTITLVNPTQIQFEQLSNSSANDLQCPCSQISIRYDTFITFQPTYHPIYSSAFVSNLWYDNQNYYWLKFTDYSTLDFRHIAPYYFALLLTLCQSTNETIINSLTQFYATEYITSQIVTANIFNSQVISLIELFQTTTQQSFKQPLDMLRAMTFGNQLISAKQSNVVFHAYNDNQHITVHPSIVSYDNCSCATDRTCKKQLSFYLSYVSEDYIPGMYLSCYIVDSLLLTTTECFFNEQCIQRIKSYMNPSEPLYQILEPLNQSSTSQYKTNTFIGTIVDNLFIENWNAIYSYMKYYGQCKPSYCSYTVNQRPEFLSVLAKSIGIFGGSSIVLKFLVPLSISIFRKEKIRQQSSGQRRRFDCDFIFIFLQEAKKKILSLNLFKSHSTNAHTIRNQRLTTRFYLIILLTIILILVLHTSLNNVSITITVKLSTENQYENLAIKYSDTLNCPCNQISIEYQKFVQIKPSYQQICSSDFISEEWIDYLYNYSAMNENNFRATAVAQFLILVSLCQLTEETVNTSLTQFYATKFTSPQLISSKLFQIQIESFITSFQTSMPQTFKRTLDTIRGLNQGNALMSAYETNWKFTVLNVDLYAPVYTNPRSYGNSCDCGTSTKCVQPAIVTEEFPSGLPGLLIGCYPLESMLQSSLECLYNQTCLDLIMLFMDGESSNITFTILNSSLPSKISYGLNETVQHMVDRLFVDNWFINKSYDNYFQECDPSHCVYSYIQNFDIVFIITTILGLYGGLTTLLKLIIPIIIHIILWFLRRRSISVIPFSEFTDHNY